MNVQEIRERLDVALKIRVPQFDPSTPAREKISKLEDHLLKCAYHRAELEEALHWLVEAGKKLREEWDSIEGHQAMLRGSRPTKEQIDNAKRQIKPEVWDSLQELRTLVDSLQRQITRLGGTDYDAVSRAYTLISGS